MADGFKRRARTCLLLLLGLTASATASETNNEPYYDFDIPRQRADLALTEFAEQADLTLIVPHELLDGRVANRLVGRYPLQEGIERLLAGTGLSPEISNHVLLSISTLERSDDSGNNMKVERKLGFFAALASVFTAGANAQDAVDVSADDQESVPLEEIIVTGSSIRGVTPESSPLDIYTQQDIQALGATNTREFLARLPQNLSAATSVSALDVFRQGNRYQINTPDLRGLGQGSTLVLLNGRRMPLSNVGRAADVSHIPVAAVDRVEVLSDGASSIYGTDAVGGVVNFILKDAFDGAVTTLTGSTVTDGSYRSGEVNQLVGKSWGSGSVLGSFTASSESELNGEDRGVTQLPYYLSPDERGQSAFLTARQNIGDRTAVFADFLYTNRDLETIRRNVANGTNSDWVEAKQYLATIGTTADINDDLTFEFIASHASSDDLEYGNNTNDDGTVISASTDDQYESLELNAKLDGKLFQFGGKEILFAAGGGRFSEDLRSIREVSGDIMGEGVTLERTTNYAFGELQIPLVDETDGFPLANGIEINVSARYTDTSDAGDSFDPKVGLLWRLNDSIQFRGTYNTSFRAPRLVDIAPPDGLTIFVLPVDVFGLTLPDPFTEDRSTVYLTPGQQSDPNLTPETADSYTIGFDFAPTFLPGFSVSGTYFNIDFTDRIDVPTADVIGALSNPDLFAAVIREATLGEITSLLGLSDRFFDFSGNGLTLDSTPEDINAVVNQVFDLGIANISSLETDGIDLSIDYQTSTGLGDLSVGAAMTYLLSNEQRLTPSSPIDERLNTVTNPVDLRFRTFVGLSNVAWSGRVNVNYVDSYQNIPESGQGRIDSWTTVDFVASYFFSESADNLLSGTEVRFTVQNLFDEDAPFVVGSFSGVTNPIGFDPANANPFGRIATVQIAKTW